MFIVLTFEWSKFLSHHKLWWIIFQFYFQFWGLLTLKGAFRRPFRVMYLLNSPWILHEGNTEQEWAFKVQIFLFVDLLSVKGLRQSLLFHLGWLLPRSRALRIVALPVSRHPWEPHFLSKGVLGLSHTVCGKMSSQGKKIKPCFFRSFNVLQV